MAASGVNVRESRFGRTRNLREFPEVEDDSHTKTLLLQANYCMQHNHTYHCSQVVEGENNIFVPKNGEWVDATTERFIYQVSC